MFGRQGCGIGREAVMCGALGCGLVHLQATAPGIAVVGITRQGVAGTTAVVTGVEISMLQT
jgi:hypothetical protein